jgi:RNA polymerase sigma-70 factor (ECF subfamily)
MEISELKAELEKQHCSSFSWAVSCCWGDREKAEEVLQLVYLKILEGKARYRGEASCKTWLFAVIRKTAASEHRKNRVRGLLLSGHRDQIQKDTWAEDPVRATEEGERQARFRQALDQLPERQREILHLVFYEDLSLQETADVLNISLGAVRKHYDRAKKRLRGLLEQSENNHAIEWRRQKNPSVVS